MNIISSQFLQSSIVQLCRTIISFVIFIFQHRKRQTIIELFIKEQIKHIISGVRFIIFKFSPVQWSILGHVSMSL